MAVLLDSSSAAPVLGGACSCAPRVEAGPISSPRGLSSSAFLTLQKVSMFAGQVFLIYAGACFFNGARVAALGANVARFMSQSLLNKSVAMFGAANLFTVDARPVFFNADSMLARINGLFFTTLMIYTIACYMKGAAFWAIASNLAHSKTAFLALSFAKKTFVIVSSFAAILNQLFAPSTLVESRKLADSTAEGSTPHVSDVSSSDDDEEGSLTGGAARPAAESRLEGAASSIDESASGGASKSRERRSPTRKSERLEKKQKLGKGGAGGSGSTGAASPTGAANPTGAVSPTGAADELC